MLRDLVRRADEVGRSLGGRRVTRVSLWVGALSHIAGSSLPARWADASRGTLAEGATVEVEVSDRIDDRRAGDVVLRSVDVSEAGR